MEQKTLLKIIVVAVVLFFMLETIAMVVVGKTPENKTIETYEGSGTVEVTVMKYYPYLIVSKQAYINESMKKRLLAMDGVDRVEEEADGVIMAMAESKYVFPVYQFLKENGITAYTKAQLYFPGEIILGDKKAYLQGGITLMIEPFVDEKQQMTMLIRAKVENGKVTDIYELKPVAERRAVLFKGTVEEAVGKKYVILIPWENRTLTASDLGIDDEGAEYRTNNYVVINFTAPIKEKREYVVAIGEGTIIVKPDFTNKTAVLEDYSLYGDLTFPDSYIIVVGDERPVDIPFSMQEYWLYSVRVSPENYTYHEIIIGYESDSLLETGEEVGILMNATISGNAVISLE